jgi:DNA gyrase/topoisomerase IV subunit A
VIRKGDVQWWVLEAKKHPESAPEIIEALAQRLVELDAETERLRDEIIRLQRSAPAAADSAEMSALRQKVANLQTVVDNISEGQDPTQLSIFFFSHHLQSARVPLSHVRRLMENEQEALSRQAVFGLRCMVPARLQDEVLLLTGQGRGLKMQPSDVPSLAEGGEWPAAGTRVLGDDEQLALAVGIADPPRFWTVVTRRGYVRQVIHITIDRKGNQGALLVESPFHNDAPVALVDGDRGDLMVITRWGKWTRFPHRAIESQGSVALELEPDDEVVAALAVESDTEILVATAAGYAMRRDTARLEARTRPGGAGKSLIQAFDVLGAFPYEPDGGLLYLSYSGKLTFVAAKDVSRHERYGKGTQVCDLTRDPAVALAFVPQPF